MTTLRQGCSDGACKIRIGPKPKQHTNGGFRCLCDLPTKLRIAIERKLATERRRVAELESELLAVCLETHDYDELYSRVMGLIDERQG